MAGVLAISIGLIEVIKGLIKRRNSNGNASSTAKHMVELSRQQYATAKAVGRLTDHVQEMTTRTAVIEKTTERIERKLEGLVV